jgi:hypothetical protein
METKSSEKISKFMKKYEALVKECGVDMAPYPILVPDEKGDGSFKIVVQSMPIDLEEQAKARRESFMAKNV